MKSKTNIYILKVYIYTVKVYNMLTKNEGRVMREILTSFGRDYSINELARICKIAPNGAFKILKKFEKEGVLKEKKIANISSFHINFDNIKTKSLLELSLIQESVGRVKYRTQDLTPLKKITQIAVIFGSYITEKEKPSDLDLLFILSQKDFKEYKKISNKIYSVMPIKVQDVLQTMEDFKDNIRKNDIIIVEALKKGFILWGHEKIIEVLKDESKR